MRCHLGQVIEYSDGARIPSAVHYSVSPGLVLFPSAPLQSKAGGEEGEEGGGPRRTEEDDRDRKEEKVTFDYRVAHRDPTTVLVAVCPCPDQPLSEPRHNGVLCRIRMARIQLRSTSQRLDGRTCIPCASCPEYMEGWWGEKEMNTRGLSTKKSKTNWKLITRWI